MGVFAALDVSQEETAICVVDQDGAILAEAKVPSCPDAIAKWLAERTEGLERVGMETGPLAVWLWNALKERQVPVVCLDARHASGVLKMMPNQTDRHDARGLAQIVRTGWFKAARIESHDAHVNRAMLTAREALVGMRVKLENETRGLLKTDRGSCSEGESVGSSARPRKSSKATWRSPRSSCRSSKRSRRPGVTSSPASPRSTVASGQLPGGMRRSAC